MIYISWQRIYRIIPFAKTRIIIHFFMYGLSMLFARSISFFVLPFIMHVIAPTQYGTLSLLTAFTTIMTTILGLGLRQMLSIEYFHATQEEHRVIIADILIIYTAIAFPVTFLAWYFRAHIIHLFFFDAVSPLQFLATLIMISSFFYLELMYQLLQYEQAIKRLVFTQCTLAMFTAINTLISVFYLHSGITGIVWSQAIGYCIAMVVAIQYLIHNYAISFRSVTYDRTIYYLWYGLPFIPTIFAHWLLSTGDRWILGYFTTMHEVGIYAVADLACQLFYAIILQSWAACYLPYIMKQYQQNKNNLLHIERKNHLIMWIGMIAGVILLAVGYPIAYLISLQLLPSAYSDALYYAWILLLGQLFLLSSYFAAAFIQYHKRTYFLAFALFIPALFNIILNIVFIPQWGIMGCSIATLISYAIYFGITYWYNRKLLKQCI